MSKDDDAKEKNRLSTHDERRGHARYSGPTLSVGIGGSMFDTINWSMGGMMVEHYQGSLSIGSIFKIISLGRANGSKPSMVSVEARVIRLDDNKDLGFTFLEVDPNAYALLQAFMAERMALMNEETTKY